MLTSPTFAKIVDHGFHVLKCPGRIGPQVRAVCFLVNSRFEFLIKSVKGASKTLHNPDVRFTSGADGSQYLTVPILIRDIDALPNLRATLPGDRNEMPEMPENGEF